MGGWIGRRGVLAGMSAAAVSSLAAPEAFAQIRTRLVVIGGGFGGATAARRLKALLPGADVTLIEPNATYMACPFSNLVVTGLRDLGAQIFSYAELSKEGVTVARDRAIDVDAVARTVVLEGGATLSYDRLVLSPGVDLRWDALEGYDETTARRLPHAWKAGAQTALLRDQLASMENGGLVVMTVPPAPYRCPPGPYERASLIAHYLKTQKPRSKLLILDAKDNFSKMPLFMEAWAELYPDHLEWRSASEDGRVSAVSAADRTVFTDFESVQGAVVNIIPPQRAGEIAVRAGVADATGWCPVNAISFESTLQPNIHVIGDASIAAPMPKSAFAANLQAKICAIAIVRMLSGQTPQPTVLANTCYSYTGPDAAVSITGVYTNEDGSLSSVPSAGGLSPLAATDSVRAAEAAQAEGWFSAVTAEAFG